MIERDDSVRLQGILVDATNGRPDALGGVLESYRDRLARMVQVRLDPRLRGRVDASDVIQETFLEVTARLPDYLERQEFSFFVWVRMTAAQKLNQYHRAHLRAEMRDVRRERRLATRTGPEMSGFSIASAICDSGSTPSHKVARKETHALLAETLESMDPTDREVLALRHFEELSNAEAAEVLGLSEPATSLRYAKAARRLAQVLKDIAGI